MKTILIATDFSDASVNAALYGFELAKKTGSRILLFHSYHILIPAAQDTSILSYEELERRSMERLESERRALDPRSELTIECITLAGFADDNIIEIEKKHKPGLIIMGMASAGKVSEHLLGSVTTSLIPRTATPLLIIPEAAKFHLPEKIVFACDYDLDPAADSLKPLKQFADHFQSRLLILNLFKKKELQSSQKAVSELMVENYLHTVEHSYHFIPKDDYVSAVNDFAGSKAADVIAVMPHKHNFFVRFFKESHTRKLVFHTHLPILAIPERTLAR